jgi:hypothetical protein
MIEKPADRFSWWLSFLLRIAGGDRPSPGNDLPEMICGNDAGTFLATLVAAAIVSLILLGCCYPKDTTPEPICPNNVSDLLRCLLALIQGL